MSGNEVKAAIKVDNQQFLKMIQQCSKAVKELEGSVKNLKVNVDIAAAKQKIGELISSIRTVEAETVHMEVDNSSALKKISSVGSCLQSIKNTVLQVELDKTNAEAQIGGLRSSLERLKAVDLTISADPSPASAALKEIAGNLEKAELQDLKVHIAPEDIEHVRQLIKKIRSEDFSVKIQVDAAARNLNHLFEAAAQVRGGLSEIHMPQKIDFSGISALNKELKQMEAQAGETQDRLDHMQGPRSSGKRTGSTGTSNSSNGFFDGLHAVSAVAAGAKEAALQIKDVAAAAVMPGFDFVKNMESSQLGIAGTLSSMAAVNGEGMDFHTAMEAAGDIFSRLQKEAARTPATTAELVETFRALVAPGLNAGGSIEEIERFTTVGVNAAKGLGLPKEQMAQELSSLVTGDISADSTVAKSLGLTSEDIEAAKHSAEGLFTFLEERMSGLAQTAQAYPDTLNGKLSALEEVSTMASAELTKALEPEIKSAVGFVTSLFAEVRTETGELELNPNLLKGIDALKEGLDVILGLFGEINQATGNFELNEGTAEMLDALGDDLLAIWDAVESLAVALDQIFNNDAFSYVQEYWLPVLGDLWNIFTDILIIIGDVIRVIGNLGTQAVEAAAPFTKIFAGAIKWAVEQLREFVEMARIGWQWLVKWSGGRKELKISHKESFQPKEAEQQQTKNIDASKIRAKDPVNGAMEKARTERVRQAKDALKEMVSYWKLELDRVTRNLDVRLGENKLKYEQGIIGINEFSFANSQLKLQKTEAALAELRKEREAAEMLPDHDPAKAEAIQKIEEQIENLKPQRDEQLKTLEDIARGMEKNIQFSSVKGLAAGNGYLEPVQAGSIEAYIRETSQKYGVDENFIKAVAKVESDFDPKAFSEAGAIGIMQLMPNTANWLGVKDPYDARQNIEGGVKYLRKILDDSELGGSLEKVAAAYNAGPQAVKDFGGVPPYAETREYVRKVLDAFKEYSESVKMPQPQLEKAEISTALSEEGTTWVRETPNVDIEGLGQKALEAISLMGDYFHAQTGRKMVVSSGNRDWGGHVSGLKFDVVDDGESTLLETNAAGIRDQMLEYARMLGIARQGEESDEYTYPSENATAGHLDFDAAGFIHPAMDQIDQQLMKLQKDPGFMRTQDSYAWKLKWEELSRKALDIVKQFNEGLGDVSTVQLAQMETEYRKTIKLMENNGLTEVAGIAKKVQEHQKLKLNFMQVQKDLEQVNISMSEYQDELAKSVSDSTVSAETLMQAYMERFHERTDQYREKLEKLLKTAVENGQADEANKIKASMQALDSLLQNGLENIIGAYEKELQMQISEINADSRMTSRQKQNAIDAAQRAYYKSEAEKFHIKIEDLKRGNGNEAEQIANLERNAALYDKLAEMPTLLDAIHQASTQAFETGLLDFLTRGVLECENLGQALRNLAISILTSIQKVTAQALADDVIASLGLGGSYASGKDKNNAQGAELSNDFGTITAETNGFLVTFDSQMGTFAIKVQQAFQGIMQNIQSAVNAVPAVMPSLFSAGISAGGSNEFSYTSSTGTNWWENLSGFVNGGEVQGPGSETSDSILARLSRGEFVINAAAVKRVGVNYLNRLNSGDLYNLQISIPKFARGGMVGDAGAKIASKGLENFIANFGASFDPTIHSYTNVQLNGAEIMQGLSSAIKAQVEHHVDKNMIGKAKFYNQLGKRFR